MSGVCVCEVYDTVHCVCLSLSDVVDVMCVCASPYQLDKSLFLADSAQLPLLCQVMNSPPDKENKNHL